MALSMQIIPGRQIYWTRFTHHGLCLTSGCIEVSPGSGGGCVPTDVLQSAATFLPRSPHSGGLGSMISRHQLQLQVQVGFNLWWQQLYWAMNSPAPTHLLLHRGTSGHQINHSFVIYLVTWNLCPFLPFFGLYKFLSVFICYLILHFPTNLMSYLRVSRGVICPLSRRKGAKPG